VKSYRRQDSRTEVAALLVPSRLCAYKNLPSKYDKNADIVPLTWD
jgi:hypothetical protein